MTAIQITAEQLAEQMKVEILALVNAGYVPSTVQSFSDLHDYCDANCLGGTEQLAEQLAETMPDSEDPIGEATSILCDTMNPAMDIVDAWIKTGVLLKIVAPAPKTGDRVRFAKPADDKERDARFILIEDRDTRVLIQLICDLPIPPRECVAKPEIMKAL